MTPEQWSRLAVLFEAASRLDDGARGEFLDRNCPEADLRRELEELLDAACDGPTFFERPAAARPDFDESETDLSGLRLGPWRIRHAVGRGGMGSVWLAEREDGQFEQQVAVKVVRKHLDGEEIRERFEWERRIQARLNHPYVCRVLDAGTTPDGRPYLVLPFIDEARPLIRYCDEVGLNFADRVELFRKVCEAAQFAHQNLVVHGDIKPGNILVGASGLVQMVDFGIARLLTAAEAGGGQIRLTPGYASPEQLAGEPPTTLTDVYSLGVLLRRLLENCHGGRRRRADVESIIDHATAGDPAERYVSARALSDDLGRMLDERPVEARGSSRLYWLGRQLRRYRWPALGLGVLLAGLIGMVAVMAVMNTRIAEEAERTAIERDRAEATAGFWAHLFESTDPMSASEVAIDIQSLLERAVSELTGDDRLPAAIRARLLGVISTAYWNLADYHGARSTAEAGIELLRESDADPVARAMAWKHLANIAVALSDIPAAREAVDRAIYWRDRAPKMKIDEAVEVMGAEALVLDEEGRVSEAARLLEQLIELRGRLPPDDVMVAQATSHGNLAYMYYRLSRREDPPEPWLDLAEAHVQKSLDLLTAHFGPDHARLGYMLNAAGVLRRARGESEQALLDFGEAERVLRDSLPPGHSLMVGLPIHQGILHLDLGRPQAAAAGFQAALDAAALAMPVEHPLYRDAYLGLARARTAAGDRGGALETLERMAEALPEAVPDSPEALWEELLRRVNGSDDWRGDADWFVTFNERLARIDDAELVEFAGTLFGGDAP